MKRRNNSRVKHYNSTKKEDSSRNRSLRVNMKASNEISAQLKYKQKKEGEVDVLQYIVDNASTSAIKEFSVQES